jgi:multisubunit Na+/H+ antiporter MnhB subunit
VRLALVAYLIVFAAAGVGSVVPDDSKDPLHERIAEAVAFFVLTFGMLWYLLGRPAPGGPIVWMAATAGACLVEFLVVLNDRRRTTRAELAEAGESTEIQRLIRATDVLVAAFFLPAVIINFWLAAGGLTSRS